MSGKGDAPRPKSVDEKTFADNWNRTFKDAEPLPVWPETEGSEL